MILASESAARDYCASLTDAAGMARLDRLADLLRSENREQNLIAKASEEILWRRHFADSAQLLAHVPRESSQQAPCGAWIDLGTGAGFPGLVIGALRPEMSTVLVESRRRRAEWLTRAAAALDLPNCRIEGRRLESVESFPASAISARAFAPLPKLLRLSARFSTRDTVWLLPKGQSARQEITELPPKTGRMFHVEHSVTDEKAGILVGKGRPEIV